MAVPNSDRTLAPNVPASGVVGNGTPASCTEAALDVALVGGGTVTFNCGAAPHTITVSGVKVITVSTQIDGGGLITLSGGGAAQIFKVNGGASLSLSNLTLINGFAGGTSGGAVVNNGALTVRNSTFQNNNADVHGGAIGNYGALSINDSTFATNTAGINGGAIDTTVTATITSTLFTTNTAGFRGGGINNYLGTLSVVESRFVGNTGNAYGGGVTNDGGTLAVMGSQFSGNTGGDFGGGLRNSGTAHVFDSTFANNSASNRGGAIENSGSLSLVSSSVSGNSAGNMGSGGLENAGSASLLFSTLISNTSVSAFGGNIANGNVLDVKASIVAFGSPLNCTGTVASLGYNLESSNQCSFTATGDLQNTDPLLGTLQDNGGPTLTHAPLTGSPALDRVAPGECVPADQRGLARPQGNLCDVGALEVAVQRPIISTANTMPWAMLGHDTRRTERGNTAGPDDPKRLGAPWPYLAMGRIGTSPAIDYAGTAYVGSDDTKLHAVDRFGLQRFTFKTGGAVRSSPAVVPVGPGPIPGEVYVPPPTSTIYFGSDDGHVYAIDSTGALKWSLAPGGNTSPVRSSPAALKRPGMALNRIYAGADNGKLYAIFETGPTSAILQWQLATSAPLTTSAALSPDGAIVYVGGTDGTLYCVDALTGAPLPNTPSALGLGALTTPAVDRNGHVYVGSARGVVRSFTRLCEPRPYFHPNLGAPINAAPALAPNGDVLIIAGNTLYGISNLGNLIWSQPFAPAIGRVAPIVDSAGTAYVAADNGTLYAVVRRRGTNQGTIRWSINIASGNTYPGAPALDGFGRIYLGASDNRLEVIDDEPAFQIAFHSDLSATNNLDIYSLRETYGVLDPARTQRLTDHSAAERQPAYSLDRSVMGYVSNRDFANDSFIADAVGSNEDNLTKPRANAPFTNISAETEPGFTPLDDLTGVSRLADQKRYLALTSNASGIERIYFVDLGAYELGNTRVLSLTAWAAAQGVPISITSQLEPPNRTQSGIAFSPDGKRVAWRNCDVGGATGELQLLTLSGITSTLISVSRFVFNPESRAICGDSPAFAPDSRWLVFREDKTLTIWDTRGVSPTIHSPGPLNGTPTHPNWAPDGSEIAAGVVTPTNGVDMFVLSSAQYTTSARLTTSGTSDEPFYHFYKMPPPQALALRPDRQFPGETIQVLGRGFEILNPQNNRVYFTDTLHTTWLPAQVLNASVDPYAGLGVLTVKVPDLAGSGNIKVETRFGVSVCCRFYVLPKPASVVQPMSVPGAKVRVFGVGFDLSPATQNRVLFTGITGTTWVTGTVISGTVVGQQEFLIVQVPQGITETGKIRVETAQGGRDCACTFTQLHPTLTVRRTTGLPQHAGEGCQGVRVRLDGTNYPYDPFFNYGTTFFNAVVEGAGVGGSVVTNTMITGQLMPTGPFTSSIVPISPTIPSLASFSGGIITVAAVPWTLPSARGTAPFRVPLKNIPIIFVPGTSGNSLDTLGPFVRQTLPDAHYFPWICKTCLLGVAPHASQTFIYNPILKDPAGPRVWLGPEFIEYLIKGTLSTPYNGGNHYLDVLGFDSNGRNTINPQITPGTVFTNVNLAPFGAVTKPIYTQLIGALSALGRPINSGANGVFLFPYDWRGDMVDEVGRLSTFVDSVISTTGSSKVVLITHSLGGPLSRAYYLSSPANAAKVEMVISMGGGFLGVPKPVKVLAMGDTWGTGWSPSIGAGSPTAFSVGFAEWETEALAQNWGTAYYQAPNSEDWFFDDTSNGGAFDRRYVIDDRLLAAPISRTYAASMNWITRTYNTTVGNRADAFFRTLSPSLGDFRNGTGTIMHHRLISNKMKSTVVTSRLYSAPSAYCAYALATGNPIAAVECVPVTWREPIFGDGDETVSWHGLLGRTGPRDDRIYVLNGVEHLEMAQRTDAHTLIGQLLNGTVCSQPQSSFLAPSAISESGAAIPSGSLSANRTGSLAGADRLLVRVRGVVQLEATDSAGNHAGPSVEHPGLYENEIAGLTYAPGLSFNYMTVKGSDTYSFTLAGISPSAVDVHVTGYAGSTELGTAFFQGVPMTGTSRAVLTYNMAAPPETPTMRLDFAGNGTFQTITPTANLNPAQNADTQPPTTTLTVSNNVMMLTATDNPGGSGVLRTYYRVDEEPFAVYSGLTTLPATWGTVTALSVDRNGNIEASAASVTRTRIFLPIIVR